MWQKKTGGCYAFNTVHLEAVVYALHEFNYNFKAIIVVIVILLNDCSVLVSNRFRLNFTNVY